MLAPIPAATIPPATAPLPASPLVNISIVSAKFLRLFVVSLPNIASKVSSPYFSKEVVKLPGLKMSATFALPVYPKSILFSKNFIKAASWTDCIVCWSSSFFKNLILSPFLGLKIVETISSTGLLGRSDIFLLIANASFCCAVLANSLSFLININPSWLPSNPCWVPSSKTSSKNFITSFGLNLGSILPSWFIVSLNKFAVFLPEPVNKTSILPGCVLSKSFKYLLNLAKFISPNSVDILKASENNLFLIWDFA